MITVYVLLCMGIGSASEAQWEKNYERCNSVNAPIYGRVELSSCPSSPDSYWLGDINSPDWRRLQPVLPSIDNPVWLFPNLLKYECHATPTS
jgi:hypothetical protein